MINFYLVVLGYFASILLTYIFALYLISKKNCPVSVNQILTNCYIIIAIVSAFYILMLWSV